MDPNELPLDRRHLGVPWGASKMISEPIARSAQTMLYLALTLTQSPSGPKWLALDPLHVGVPLGASKMIS
jgi:hypothetical protein